MGPDYTLLLIMTNIISFGLGGLLVFWLFVRSESHRNRRLRDIFRRKLKAENGGPPEQGI